MRNFDLSPLFRTSVGFDRLNQLLDTALRVDAVPSYPPYNIEKLGEDSYRVSMAVAGFGENDIEVFVQDDTLTVSGKVEDKTEDKTEEKGYLHRGIAERAFTRSFRLADHIKVTGATLDNGLLHIDLEREVPEALKPRRIAISTGKAEPKALAAEKAA